MDLSDGLSLDLHRLSKASGLSAEIEAPPIFRGATLTQALHGGEDYELLFTVPARRPGPRQIRRTSSDANWYDAKRPRGRGSYWMTRRSRTAGLRPFSKTMSLPDPEPVLDLIEAFRRSKTMFVAVSLGIFDRLSEAPATAAQIAALLNAHAGRHGTAARCVRGARTDAEGGRRLYQRAGGGNLPLRREPAFLARLHPLFGRSPLSDVGQSRPTL